MAAAPERPWVSWHAGFRRPATTRQRTTDPGYLRSGAGEARAKRFISLLLFGQRASYLIPAAANPYAAAYLEPAVNLAALAAAVTWNVVLAVAVLRRGWFDRWMVAVDIVLACVLLFVVTANCAPELAFTAVNWSPKYALGTAALIGAALAARPAILCSLVPMAGYVAAFGVARGAIPPLVPNMVGHLNSCLWFGLLLYAMRRYLCSQSRILDAAVRQRLMDETSRAAQRARFDERIAHYRKLHDTALATLTAIARGGLDHRGEQVRRRAAKDADYIRRLIMADTAEGFTDLGDRLAEVVLDAEGLGLRVHYQHDALPPQLPPTVMDAIVDSTREALNNVSRHAEVSDAWLTADCTERTLVVRVVDRGRGFALSDTPHGHGLRGSITGRMWNIGGSVDIFSLPGEGTSVELSWSPDHDSLSAESDSGARRET